MWWRRNGRHHSACDRADRSQAATVRHGYDNANRVSNIAGEEFISGAGRTHNVRAARARPTTILPLIHNRHRTTSPSTRRRGQCLTFSRRTTNRWQHRIRRSRGRRRRNSRHHSTRSRTCRSRATTVRRGHNNTNRVFHIARGQHISRARRTGNGPASCPGNVAVLPLVGKRSRTTAPRTRSRGKGLTFSRRATDRRQRGIRRSHDSLRGQRRERWERRW